MDRFASSMRLVLTITVATVPAWLVFRAVRTWFFQTVGHAYLIGFAGTLVPAVVAGGVFVLCLGLARSAASGNR